jgi:hypothetical protein
LTSRQAVPNPLSIKYEAKLTLSNLRDRNKILQELINIIAVILTSFISSCDG